MAFGLSCMVVREGFRWIVGLTIIPIQFVEPAVFRFAQQTFLKPLSQEDTTPELAVPSLTASEGHRPVVLDVLPSPFSRFSDTVGQARHH